MISNAGGKSNSLHGDSVASLASLCVGIAMYGGCQARHGKELLLKAFKFINS
jgi:hypothetical protein